MSAAAERMLGHLPALTAGSDFFGALLGAEGDELDRLQAALARALAESNPLTATAAGLAALEEQYGLGALTGSDLEQRRARVLAFMRARGTATPDRVKAVANAFENGDVELVEDFANQVLTLRFASVHGVPPNAEAMLAAVRRVVPARARLLVAYLFSVWDQVDGAGLTWDQVDALGLTWDQFDAHGWA